MVSRYSIFVLLYLLVIGFLSGVWAHEGATGVVKERMDGMKSMADAMKVLTPMARGKVKFDFSLLKSHADTISGASGQHLLMLFQEPGKDKSSEASPKIWQEWEEFSEYANELKRYADELGSEDSAQKSGTSEPIKLIKQMGQTCKSCHKGYRVKK